MSSVSDRASSFRSADAGFFGSDAKRQPSCSFEYQGATRALVGGDRFHFNTLTDLETLPGWNGTDQFTAPITGTYRISVICGNVAGTAAYAQVYLDPISGGADLLVSAAHLAATTGTCSMNVIRNLTAGDIIFVVAGDALTQGGNAPVGPTSHIAIELLARA